MLEIQVMTSRLESVNGHKLKTMKFHLNMRKNIFTMRVVKDQNRFAQRSCGLSTFGDIQSLTGHILDNLL